MPTREEKYDRRAAAVEQGRGKPKRVVRQLKIAGAAADYIQVLEAERRYLEMRAWHDFYLFLTKLGVSEPVPRPLILAANVASPKSKLARLGDQLEWAERNHLFSDAASYLDSLPAGTWSSSDVGRWARECEAG